MDMKIGLNIGLQQRLVMTPKLQQALKLLQMPTLELQQVLKQEVLQNPLLEEIDDADMEADEEEPATEELAERKTEPVYRQELERVAILRGEKGGLKMVCRYPALSAISPCFSNFFQLDFII